MSIQIRDESIAAALSNVDSPDDVVGPDGKLLGRFVPVSQLKIPFPEFDISDDEIIHLIQDPNPSHWHTPDEVLARLRGIDECTG
jgi:hypothetical protein